MRFISNTLMRMGVLFAQLAINAPFKLLHSSPINIRTDLENS